MNESWLLIPLKNLNVHWTIGKYRWKCLKDFPIDFCDHIEMTFKKNSLNVP